MKNRIVLRELFVEQYQFVGSWVSDQPITLRPSSKEAKECRRQLAQLQAQKRNKTDVEKG